MNLVFSFWQSQSAKNVRLLLSLMIALVCVASSSAQEESDVSIDDSNAQKLRTNPFFGDVIDQSFYPRGIEGRGAVYATAVQPDGKILIGGNFTNVNNFGRRALERLHEDGRRDTSFNRSGTGFNNNVYSIVVLSDGKILVGGYFTAYNGVEGRTSRLALLNADGTLDTSFNTGGAAANDGIQDIVLQPDGKILISGAFTSYNGVGRNRIARLNPDGSLDTSFNPGAGSNNFTEEIVLQPDGKILIAGTFTSYNNINRNGVARLNTDGTLDFSFNPGSGIESDASPGAYALEQQPDGKILIGGFFSSFNNTNRANVARLNSDGSLDASFNPTATNGNGVEYFIVEPDGKILVAGFFEAEQQSGILRLNADGSLDTTFELNSTNDTGYVIAKQMDGKILLGGLFSQYGGVTEKLITRLNADGSVDPSLSVSLSTYGIVRAIATQQNRKVLIGGFFQLKNNVAQQNIARLNNNGSLDRGFNPGTGADSVNAQIYSLAVQTDGKILVGGIFSSFNGVARNGIVRLNPDGSLDSTFNLQFPVVQVFDIKILPDNKILLGGYFAEPFFISGIVRLNADGTRDTSFSNFGSNSTVRAVEVQPDNKILIGGSFTTAGGFFRNRIARLNANGSPDATFNPGSGANSTVYDIALLPNNQIYVAGFFTSFNGNPNVQDLVRLNSNGSIDPTFTTGLGFNRTSSTGGIYSVVPQNNGTVLAGGGFTSYNSQPVNHIARLTATGALDNTFRFKLNSDDFFFVWKIFKQSENKVLVGGRFSTFGTFPRESLVRLQRTQRYALPVSDDNTD